MSTIESRVKEVIARQLGISTDQVTPASRLAEDLGADSLDEVEIVMEMEDEFELEISDDQGEKIKTVQQAIDYLTASGAK